MKKFIFIGIMMVANVIFAQREPQLEMVENSVKATYFHENGTVAQVGFFKDGKLDGKWISYDQNGKVTAIAEYSNGAKSGKWQYFNDTVASKEVIFSNNQIVAVNSFDKNFIAKN